MNNTHHIFYDRKRELDKFLHDLISLDDESIPEHIRLAETFYIADWALSVALESWQIIQSNQDDKEP